jgi:hypothetical protein
VHLVEILLPVCDNQGQPFAAEKYAQVREELSRRFGGVTAFMRAPAHGETRATGILVRDDIIVFEIMTETLAVSWWRDYRRALEKEFAQNEIIVRVSAITRL